MLSLIKAYERYGGTDPIRRGRRNPFRPTGSGAFRRPKCAKRRGRVMPERTARSRQHGLTNYGDRDFSLYLRRSFAQSMGYSRDDAGEAGGRHRLHAVRLQQLPPPLSRAAGGGEARRAGGRRAADRISRPSRSARCSSSPTSLKFRNLMSIDTEEMIRAQPMDAVVLMGGCDKTVPAQLMGAVSAGRPAMHAGRRPDDDRPPPRRAARRLHRLPPLLGALPRRRGRATTRSTRSRASSRPPPAPAR